MVVGSLSLEGQERKGLHDALQHALRGGVLSIPRSYLHVGLASPSPSDGPQALAFPRERIAHGWRGQLRRALFWLFLIGLGLLLVSSFHEAVSVSTAATSDRGESSAGFGAAGASLSSGPCHPLANGAANLADSDPACQPANPAQCPHPSSSGPVPSACLPLYEAALKAPPSPQVAGMACHPLPDGSANPYDADPACQPADPAHCVRVAVGPPAPGCFPAYLAALEQPPLPGTDCHPLPDGSANPYDADPACQPADPAHCVRVAVGPPDPACGFAGPLPGLSPTSSPSQTRPGSLSAPPVNTGNFMSDNFWEGLEHLVADCWNQVLDWFGSFTFVLQTPKALSYGHLIVETSYRWSLSLLGGLTSLALVVTGYRLMIGGQGASSLAWVEHLWGLVLALVLAFFGLALVGQGVELCNLASRGLFLVFGGSAAGTLGFQDIWSGIRTVTAPLAWILFAIVALVMLLLLSIVRLVQIALLDLLIALMPLWLLMTATPGLRPYGRLAATLLVEVLLCQVAQDAVLAMGAALIGGFGHASATPISLLVGLAACYLALRVPALVSRAMHTAQAGLPGIGEQLTALVALLF